MDPLASFLDGPRARAAFLLQVLMSSPWSIRVEDHAPLTLVVVRHGSAWLVPSRGEAEELSAGDVLLVQGTAPYVIADAPGTPCTAVIHPGQHCSGPGGEDLTNRLNTELRTWGNDPEGQDRLLIGTYTGNSEVGKMLLAALPAHIVVRGARELVPVIELIEQELMFEASVRAGALDRLLDLLLIRTVRALPELGAPQRPGWLAAQSDQLVHEALRAMHKQPGHPWTIESLARSIGTSRANLARRFTAAVGQPPMTYLSQHRLNLAADMLLGDARPTTAAIAARVGYSNPYSFSHAFKAHHGTGPQSYRRNALETAGQT